MQTPSYSFIAMARTRINRCLAYLLILLLPLQAAAWGRMAICADMALPAHPAAASMAHCPDSASAQPPISDAATPAHYDGATCWIGSICIATVGALAVAPQHSIAFAERNNPIYPAVIAHYQSVVLDGLQRPPPALQH